MKELNSYGLDLRSFIKSIPIPMTLVNAQKDFLVEIANPAYEEQMGLQVEGKKVFEFLSSEIQSANDEQLRLFTDIRKTGKTVILRSVSFDLGKGKLQYFDVFYFAMKEEESVRYILIFAVEVTEAREYAEKLRHEKDLRDSFLSHLTHDLNQPMYIAKTSLQALARKLRSEDDKRLTALGIDGVQRTETMIRNLLDSYYLDSTGRNSLKVMSFIPCEIAKTLIDVLSWTYGDRFVLLEEEFIVEWDREAFVRILDNLLSNAVKHSHPGSVITVAFWTSEKSIFMGVHNTGSYIPPEETENIFNMYQRGSSARGKEGWGLGLHIVKRLTESHNGHVRVESSEENGTLFEIELPRVIGPSSN